MTLVFASFAPLSPAWSVVFKHVAAAGSASDGSSNVKRVACHVVPSSVLRQTSSFTRVNTVLGGPATTSTQWTSGFGICPLILVHVSPPSSERLAELLGSCGLSLVDHHTLGREIEGKRALAGFATAIVK